MFDTYAHTLVRVSFVGYTGGQGGSPLLWNLQKFHAVLEYLAGGFSSPESVCVPAKNPVLYIAWRAEFSAYAAFLFPYEVTECKFCRFHKRGLLPSPPV